jgi:hypothetical protein
MPPTVSCDQADAMITIAIQIAEKQFLNIFVLER